MITLHMRDDGQPCHVRAEAVVMIQANIEAQATTGTYVYVGGAAVVVRETADEVLEMLNGQA